MRRATNPRREENVPATFSDGKDLPKVLVFDLDYTLWSFWIDTHATPPLKAKDGGSYAVDSTGESFRFYKEVPDILSAAYMKDIPLGIASRTCAPDLAESLLKLLKVHIASTDPAQQNTPSKAWELFKYRQIYPGDKRTHLTRISKSSGVACEDILFFDDEHRNRNVESLGVCFWLIRAGVTAAEVDNAVWEWRKRRGVPR